MGYFEVKGRVLSTYSYAADVSAVTVSKKLGTVDTLTVTASKQSCLVATSERVDSAQFFRNSDSRDVSRKTVSTLPLTSKYPKFPEPSNQPSILTGEIHSEDTPHNEPWTTRLRPRRPPTPSLENGSKRRAETSSKTLKPTRRYRKNLYEHRTNPRKSQ